MKSKFFTQIAISAMALMIFILIRCANTSHDDAPWVSLFDGKTLNGWEKKGGNANYRVEESAIVGSTAFGKPSTFLISEKKYHDFILELDTKVDPEMNSGILIRANSFDYYKNGRVHGYQAEIDPSERAWSGGIYESGLRGWLFSLVNNPDARRAFKQNEWNHYRIEFIGDTLQTWINGVPAANLIDDRTASGFIALQVHGIDKDEKEGEEVMWRNIKILTENLDQYNRKMPLTPVNTTNTLTMEEKEDGWQLLWDGKTTHGWRGARLDKFPEDGWAIKDGKLVVHTTGGGESAGGGDIVTEKLYGDFDLKVDFKITDAKTANSGIKYYVDTDINKGPGSSIGLEYQILGREHPGNAHGNHDGSHTMGSLYDLIAADPIPVRPAGQWNTARITSKGGHVEHFLNDVKVLEYDRHSAEFRKLVSESKYKKFPSFGEAAQGRILLQDHGSTIAFKNIKIKEL